MLYNASPEFKNHDILLIKGTVMGPLLALVCPCFRKNVIVTCKFLCGCVGGVSVEIFF